MERHIERDSLCLWSLLSFNTVKSIQAIKAINKKAEKLTVVRKSLFSLFIIFVKTQIVQEFVAKSL